MVPEDRFSFLLTEQEYQDRYVTAAFAGFGFSSVLTTDNRVLIRYVYDNSPAAEAGINRADQLIAVDGVDVNELLEQGTYNEALGPSEAGVTVELTWRNPAGDEFTEVITKESVATNTVFAPQTFSVDGREVGYFVLDSFINRTGDDLNEAYNQMAAANVDDLVIDVRYNGGGLIRYANQLATQAAGNNVIGEEFLTYNFNSNNQNMNETVLFGLGEGVQQLDLERVFVLTTGASCSSSEILINSLEPFVEVVVVGGATCGKPVGQLITPLCDKRTFVVNFETVNALDEGRYFDGLQPTCPAIDTIATDWGDPADPLLAAASSYIETGSCPVALSQATALSKDAIATGSIAEVVSDQPKGPALIEKWRSEH